jgi:hypothetical protein
MSTEMKTKRPTRPAIRPQPRVKGSCDMARKTSPAKIESDGSDIFFVLEGKRIAKRGRPGTPHHKRWIPLEPGFTVHDSADLGEIIVERDGVCVH